MDTTIQHEGTIQGNTRHVCSKGVIYKLSIPDSLYLDSLRYIPGSFLNSTVCSFHNSSASSTIISEDKCFSIGTTNSEEEGTLNALVDLYKGRVEKNPELNTDIIIML